MATNPKKPQKPTDNTTSKKARDQADKDITKASKQVKKGDPDSAARAIMRLIRKKD